MQNIHSDDHEIREKYSNLLKQIGEQVRALRKAKGMSQIDLCAMIQADKSFISNIENGHTNVTIKTMVRIANAVESEIVFSLKVQDH